MRGHRPAENLGVTVSLRSLSEYAPALAGRGLLMQFTGEPCALNGGKPSTLNVTLICDLNAGTVLVLSCKSTLCQYGTVLLQYHSSMV